MEKANADKPITKESIDKKLGFDFTTYSSGIRTDTECDIEYENPFKILSDEEGDFIIEYYREKKKNREILNKRRGE
ncbi:hypothetical protein SAMN05421767_13611 [Granulicatella balaenopterae]|uniref:Uncharacterized protein n=1 Tax=Granulicatella balaenopterae TaxID=137733 RepID=A0A1H9N7X7_9LACT|nr:hypothetical protein [Granulicatella balaenopterae]SER32034.1 hypothetical protein SAMN05421767_13611 [Granulicatella balaenopterae]